jgi:hypothetical protein
MSQASSAGCRPPQFYFRDPDGHLLDYLAMLDGNPRPECGVVSWSRWTS